MRYADRPTPAGTSRGGPSTESRTSSPAARTRGRRVEDVAAGRRLHDHDAHVVRDHVVELARDARLLLRDRARRLRFALAFEPRGLLLELARIGAPRAEVVAEDPRRREDDQLGQATPAVDSDG